MKKIFSILFSLVLVLTLGLVMAVPVAASPGIAGLWHLDDGSGTSAADSSGNSNGGTLQPSGSEPAWVADQWGGKALSFDGTNDYVLIANESNFDFDRDDPFTIEAWVQTSSNAILNIVTKMPNSAPSTGYQLIKHDNVGYDPGGANKLYFFLVSVYNSDMIVVYGSTNIADGSWHHVAVTYDGSASASGVQIYVDGTPETMNTRASWNSVSGSILNNLPLQISGRDGSNYAFNGLIDEVRIWDSATLGYTVDATPVIDFNPVNTSHTITATISPIAPGVPVHFDIMDGPNIGDSLTVNTDSSGVATWTYTGDGGGGTDTICVWVDLNWDGVCDMGVDACDEVEKFWLENFVTGGGKENASNSKKVAYSFAGTVGPMADASIVGQFQIVDHTGTQAEAWHAGNGDFTFLNFWGDDATSPPASHSWARFDGTFTSNLGNTKDVHVRIHDANEPGAGWDSIDVEYWDGDSWSWETWFNATPIDGGNFQVHDIE